MPFNQKDKIDFDPNLCCIAQWVPPFKPEVFLSLSACDFFFCQSTW